MFKENSSKHVSKATSILNTYKERPFIKHQWEELMQQLSQMSDPKFKDLAKREMDSIHKNNAWFMQLKQESRPTHPSEII